MLTIPTQAFEQEVECWQEELCIAFEQSWAQKIARV
jgi:hypothetical protein